MSGITLSVTVPRELGEDIARLEKGLADRAVLHEALGKSAGNLTRDHLINIAGTRHDSANRLGASPTGHWAEAAEKMEVESNADTATITINQVGIGRVAHDVTLRPGGGRTYLTIPVAAESYGTRAREFAGLKMVANGRTGVLLAPGVDGKVLFALVTEVTQRQDRTLLPSDEAYLRAGLDGVEDYVDYLLERMAA